MDQMQPVVFSVKGAAAYTGRHPVVIKHHVARAQAGLSSLLAPDFYLDDFKPMFYQHTLDEYLERAAPFRTRGRRRTQAIRQAEGEEGS